MIDTAKAAVGGLILTAVGLTEANVVTPIDTITKINGIVDIISTVVLTIVPVVTTYFLVRDKIKKKD